MERDPIFSALPSPVLVEASRYLSFNTYLPSNPPARFSDLDPDAQAAWLNQHRDQLEDEFCSIGSWTFGTTKSYGEIVRDLAQHMGVTLLPPGEPQEVERAIVAKVWNDAAGKLTAEQLAKLRAQAEELASKYGKTLGTEISGFAALSAAQISGFGVYLLGSTVLGAINGALGLGLGFGVFTGLSSLISVVIGPLGWSALGLAAIVKLGAPNYKKVLPVVILIATNRELLSHSEGDHARAKTQKALDFEERKPARLIGDPSRTIDSDTILELQQDIDRRTCLARPAKIAPEAQHRKVTRQERIIFELRNPEICRVAAEFGLDYFEISPGDQQAIRDCVREREELAAPQPQRTAKTTASKSKQGPPKVPRSSQSDSSLRKRDARHLKQDVSRTRAQFRYTLHTLEFKDAALEYYCSLSSQDQLPFLSELSRMNRGYLDGKRPIRGTSPKLFEMEAGKAGRIYYRRQEGAVPVLIERIGDKHTQDADCADLRNGQN